MNENDPQFIDTESYEYMLAYEKRTKRLIGAMAIGGVVVTVAAGAEAIFDFTEYITNFVATGIAVSGVLFTGSKIGYLYKIHESNQET